MILHLPIEPIGCPRPRATFRGGYAGVHMPETYRRWQVKATNLIVEEIKRVGWGAFAEHLTDNGARISVFAVFPRPASRSDWIPLEVWRAGGRIRRLRKPDADNVLKAVIDALQCAIVERYGVAAWDDSRLEVGSVDRWTAAKGEEPHIRMTLEPLEDA